MKFSVREKHPITKEQNMMLALDNTIRFKVWDKSHTAYGPTIGQALVNFKHVKAGRSDIYKQNQRQTLGLRPIGLK